MSMESGLSRATCNLCNATTIIEHKDEFFGCPMGWSHLGDTEERGGKLQYTKHVCARCLETLGKNVRKKGGE